MASSWIPFSVIQGLTGLFLSVPCFKPLPSNSFLSLAFKAQNCLLLQHCAVLVPWHWDTKLSPSLSISLPSLSFPGGSDGKVSACNSGDLGSIPGSGRSPWRRKWQPTPVLLPAKFHGLRSLVGYRLWGRKELDRTEQLHFLFPSLKEHQFHSWAS